MSDQPSFLPQPELDPEEVQRIQHEANEIQFRLERVNRQGLPYNAPIICICGEEMPFHESGFCAACRQRFVEKFMLGSFDERLITPPDSIVQPIPLDEILNTRWDTTPTDPLSGIDPIARPVPWWTRQHYPLHRPFAATLPSLPGRLHRCRRVYFE
ncbi:MAG TPA: hypothetical protein VHO69_07490, partial [Phototrophicaceae bacterium]|nr:hypothetical protein [Phototrophicaceae bacterium]